MLTATRRFMNFDLNSLTENIIRGPGAKADALNKTTSGLDFTFPKDYLEFMGISNGGEGFISENNYLSLWKIEELVDWNSKYDVDTFAPGYFIFASNGGGTAYAFNKKNSSIVAFEFIGMLIEDKPIVLGNTFFEFLNSLYQKTPD